MTSRQFKAPLLKQLFKEFIATKEWMTKGIYDARAKDYTNPYRKMVYENNNEMNKVLGKLEDNSFLQNELGALDELKKTVKKAVRKLGL